MVNKTKVGQKLLKFLQRPNKNNLQHPNPPCTPDDNILRLLDVIGGPANTNDYKLPPADKPVTEPTSSVVVIHSSCL